MDIVAKKFHVTVIFDPSKVGTDPFSYDLDGVLHEDSFAVTIDKELGLLVLRLETLGGGALAAFATDPVQWLSAAMTPVPAPAGLSVSRDSDDKVTIVDVNSVTVGQVDLPFEISVMYQGKTYTSPEPTIINTPITGDPAVLAAETRAAAELFIS